jgi:clan AA aspartic protease
VISGHVTSTPEAVVPLRVRGPAGDEADIEAVIDTGFTDYLTLHPVQIAQLGLLKMDALECEMADGRVVAMESFLTVVLWDGTPRDVLVLAAVGQPLLGMSLLYGSRISIDVVSAGEVTIHKLNRTP